MTLRSNVDGEIAAEESALQMIIRPALHDLKRFFERPTNNNTEALNSIPAVYRVLKDELESYSGYSQAVLDVCRWMHARGSAVLQALIVHKGAPPDGLGLFPPGKWNKVRLISSQR